MKTKFLYIAALASVLMFTACEKQEPYDTQSPDDAPLILKPYNESGTGSFSYLLANPDTPLFDSVTVTPSKYTTVNWYLDGELVHTGTKIEKCFLAGKYALTIEAVTTAGKRTERKGSVTVNPYAADPYSAAPAAGRHVVPGAPSALDGVNLAGVTAIDLTSDLAGEKVVKTITPASATDTRIEFTLPDMEDGTYFVRLKDEAGKRYGADQIQVHNSSIILDGYSTFAPNAEWTITGLKLQNVASVKVGEVTISELTVTEASITFTAPNLELGQYTLSVKDKDGAAVPFLTADGLVTEVTTMATQETTLWEGSCVIDWGASNVNVDKAAMSAVPAGATVYVYYNVPSAEYYSLRIVVAPDWSADIVAQIDGMDKKPSPFSFTYDSSSKALAEADDKNGILVTGFGLEITKVTYK